MELWKDPPVILVKYSGSIVFHRDRAEFYPEKKIKKCGPVKGNKSEVLCMKTAPNICACQQ